MTVLDILPLLILHGLRIFHRDVRHERNRREPGFRVWGVQSQSQAILKQSVDPRRKGKAQVLI